MASSSTNPRDVRPIFIVGKALAERRGLEPLLTSHGYQVLLAQSGRYAMRMLKHERPSVIIVDHALPDETGWQFAEQIRAFDTAVPIILFDQDRQTVPSGGRVPAVQARVDETVSDEELLTLVQDCLKMPRPPKPKTRWPGKVLVVDDEPNLRILVEKLLTANGFAVATASSGEDALAQLEQVSPMVVLLDLQMPGMGGLATLKEIKARRPNTTVIMITGVEEEAIMDEALAHGAYDYITKPFNFEYLETMLLSKILLGQVS